MYKRIRPDEYVFKSLLQNNAKHLAAYFTIIMTLFLET